MLIFEGLKEARFGKYVIKTLAGEVKRQRYRCKSCQQTFNDLTDTPLQRTRRPHLWVRFIECMIDGFSLRKCAKLLRDEVTHVTLFYWRHKILSALKQIQPETFRASSKWMRPISCSRKRAKGISLIVSPVNVVVKPNTVESVTTKYVYWSLVTVRR